MNLSKKQMMCNIENEEPYRTSPNLLVIKSSIRIDSMNSFHTWENFETLFLSNEVSCQNPLGLNQIETDG